MEWIYDGGQAARNESIFEAAPFCETYGLKAMNLSGSLLRDPALLKEADKCIKAHGLHWGMLETPYDTFSEDLSDEEFEAGLETMKRWAELGAEIGAVNCYNHIWSGSNLHEYEEHREWVINRARKIFAVLDAAGIRYGCEFLGPVPLRNSFKCKFINNLAGELAIADEISPRFGFVFDTYHWYTGTNADMGELHLAAAHVDRMINFHVDDGLPERTREEQTDLERAMPMSTGVINSKLAADIFKSKGYKGLVLCEPLNLWRAKQAGRPLEDTIKEIADGYKAVDA